MVGKGKIQEGIRKGENGARVDRRKVQEGMRTGRKGKEIREGIMW